jgi:hypothetical protein
LTSKKKELNEAKASILVMIGKKDLDYNKEKKKERRLQIIFLCKEE